MPLRALQDLLEPWNYPKKPYAIKFNEKQSFLDMPKAKKWVMLANYKDRTLIRMKYADCSGF